MDHDRPSPAPSLSEPAVVHQAAGMVAAQLGISVRDAYDAIDGYAERIRWPMRAVAAEIVARSLTLTDDDPALSRQD